MPTGRTGDSFSIEQENDLKRMKQQRASGDSYSSKDIRKLESSKAMQHKLSGVNKSLGDQIPSIKQSTMQDTSVGAAPISGATSQNASDAIDTSGGDVAANVGISMASKSASNMITNGGTTTNTAAGGAGGAIEGGTSMLATGNPYLIGGAAIVGGITGGMKAKAARKKAIHEADATHQKNIAVIEGQKADRLSSALDGLSKQFGATLNNNSNLSI